MRKPAANPEYEAMLDELARCFARAAVDTYMLERKKETEMNTTNKSGSEVATKEPPSTRYLQNERSIDSTAATPPLSRRE